MAHDDNPIPTGSGERLSRLSLDSLKERLAREQAAAEAMRRDVAERIAQHDQQPKGVSPVWLVGGLFVAIALVIGLILAFPPAALEEWSIEFQGGGVDVDIPGEIPEPEPEPAATAEGSEEEEEEGSSTSTMRRRPRPTSTTSTTSTMSVDVARPPANRDNDPLYGL